LNTVQGAGFFNNQNGLPEGVIPEWKAQWTLDWSYGNFGASTNVEWLDSTTERTNFGNTKIESETYVDLTVRYNMPWGTQISGGITNILDNDPPFIVQGFNANTDSDTFRMLGRSWFARVTHNF
jgi:outer membrane receptor for ferrienterochelin and colicin